MKPFCKHTVLNRKYLDQVEIGYKPKLIHKGRLARRTLFTLSNMIKNIIHPNKLLSTIITRLHQQSQMVPSVLNSSYGAFSPKKCEKDKRF